jgi:predicted dienelactone hydrolase
MPTNTGISQLTAAALATGTLLAVALGATVAAAAPAPTRTTTPLRLELPAPAGTSAIGSTELRLVDKTRPNPWTDTGARELMVSIWYPALSAHADPGPARPRAPYMRDGAAAQFDRGAAKNLGVEPGTVDWAGTRTHARLGPPAAKSHGRRPVVIYDPGMYNERTLGTAVVEELASRGYVVVTVDHPGEANAVEFPDGRVETPAPKLEAIADPAERTRAALKVRVADDRFVLDEIERLAAGRNPDADGRRLPRDLNRTIDPKRIGMFGHSLGGMATAETMRQDRRVDAGMSMDGPMAVVWNTTDPDGFLPVARTGLDRPFLFQGAELPTLDGTGLVPHTHRNSPCLKSFWERSTGFKRDLHWPKAKHNTFTDYPSLLPEVDRRLGLPKDLLSGLIGTVDPDRAVAAQRTVASAFFDRSLDNKHRPILDGPSPALPEVDFIR